MGTYLQSELRSTVEKPLELGKNHIWDCKWSGKYVSYKTAPPEKQRNKGSKRIGCPFLMNAYKSKGPNNETIIKLTLMHSEHNYQLIPENASFAISYQKLITDMKELIESYTICAIDVLSQGCDTAKLFQHFEKEHTKNPDCIFAVVDNNFKLQIIAQAILPNETSESYRWVLQQTIEATGVQPGAFIIDADLGLESVVPEIYSDTYLLHCVWHIGHNIEKQLAKLLETFKKYWKQLMIDFPKSTEYLLRQLDPRKTTWAKAFTGQVFTAEIMSTQQSESINSVIKWTVNERTQLHLHTDQMNEAVMYCNKRVSFENLYNLTLEIVDNGLIEIKYDFYQIQFDELLEESEKAYFHIFLIPRCWYKDEFMNTIVADEPFNIMLIELPVQTAAKVIGYKQSIKGTLLGLARKCVEVVNYDDLNNSKILMKTFKEWIRIHEEAQCDK
ncbi:9002_t:CDS:2 [Cetraspora pellucida]|uniref:9002_t:CDS:1 n=1 Tax=Cetraspora pellucida TaxID=1433469 RepID=A0ACA9NF76_9GLOM|nr:9002_t:CDS:2 [Cetraspora pellucida]